MGADEGAVHYYLMSRFRFGIHYFLFFALSFTFTRTNAVEAGGWMMVQCWRVLLA